MQRAWHVAQKLPYTLGIGATAIVGATAIPAVFHRGAVDTLPLQPHPFVAA